MNPRAYLPTIFFAAAVAIISCALAVEPAPATAPTSTPTADPTTNASAGAYLPPEFQLFQTRSAFSADGHASSAPSLGPSGPEPSLVLRGIAQIDDHFTAIFEDAAGKNAIQAEVGDPVGTGRVKSIDLDEVEYESASQSRQISVGQNLQGERVAPIPTSKPAPPPGDNPASAGNGAPPDGGPPQPPGPNPRHKKGN